MLRYMCQTSISVTCCDLISEGDWPKLAPCRNDPRNLSC